LLELKNSFAHVDASKTFDHPETDAIVGRLGLTRFFEIENISYKHQRIQAQPLLWNLTIRDALSHKTGGPVWPYGHDHDNDYRRKHPSHAASPKPLNVMPLSRERRSGHSL